MAVIQEAGKKRVLLVSTHPNQTNGYSKVTYRILKHLGAKDDIELINYGFQNFGIVDMQSRLTRIPPAVTIYDAARAEGGISETRAGFGFGHFRDFLKLARPKAIIVFNDAVVVSTFLLEIKKQPSVLGKDVKVITYLNTVYAPQRPDLLALIDSASDHIITFTKRWMESLRAQGVRTPMSALMHGFDEADFPEPREAVVRKEGRMVVLNLNRNTHRKRMDITAMAIAEVFKRRPNADIVFLLPEITGAWDVPPIIAHEMSGTFSQEEITRYRAERILTVENRQKMTDQQVSDLYRLANVGLSTTQGEGVGLAQLEHAGIGRPQIAPAVGGLTEFLDGECSMLVEPKVPVYVDKAMEPFGGRCDIVDYRDVADAILYYYDNPDVRKRHVELGSKRIKKRYAWPELMDGLYETIQSV
jgi:glycosyltransferase involved in cell wall biosynthesis